MFAPHNRRRQRAPEFHETPLIFRPLEAATAPRAVAAATAPQQARIVLARPEDVLTPPTSLMEVGVPATPPAARNGEIVDAAYVEAPSFDCGAARTLADQMVCVDPALAQADRRMARAYKAAMSSGVASGPGPRPGPLAGRPRSRRQDLAGSPRWPLRKAHRRPVAQRKPRPACAERGPCRGGGRGRPTSLLIGS